MGHRKADSITAIIAVASKMYNDMCSVVFPGHPDKLLLLLVLLEHCVVTYNQVIDNNLQSPCPLTVGVRGRGPRCVARADI